MIRPTTTELLADRHSRLVTAHPDDSIWYASLRAGYLDEALLTRGEEGRNGRIMDRLAEERAAAHILGISEVLEPYGGTDGSLHREVGSLAIEVAKEAIRDNVDILIGNLLRDHVNQDHLAAGKVAIAAGQLALAEGHNIGVLLLRPDDLGDYRAPANPMTITRTYMAARHHTTQWDMQDDPRDDYVQVPGGYYMHPQYYAELGQYPIMRDASYDLLDARQLIGRNSQVPELVGSTLY